MQRHIHLEHDGKVLLVDADGHGPNRPVMGRTDWPGRDSNHPWLLRLPTESEARDIVDDWQEKRVNRFDLSGQIHEVVHALPLIEWPEPWAWKDSIISDSAVHPVARESAYRSMHRLVSKVVIRDPDGFILMGKIQRGHFIGCWTLPGGYLDYAEHPRIGAVREAMEEMGIEIEIPDPHGEAGEVIGGDGFSLVQERIFSPEGVQYVSFTYLVDLPNRPDTTPKQGEIAEAAWFSPDDALAEAESFFDIEATGRLK